MFCIYEFANLELFRIFVTPFEFYDTPWTNYDTRDEIIVTPGPFFVTPTRLLLPLHF
ncbi:hypothetical protein [Bacillus sp. FJAT-45066]|uniref:hypothetical protein n=1 Tax=Bacillus sp. FJAT-45066 TaxID=2011010 RepID=UPI0015968205|nr:hypothetical protein [Bacillus sp. FJAT-45066]